MKTVLSDLNPEQKKKVRAWPKKNAYVNVVKPLSDKVFGTKTRTNIPFEGGTRQGDPDKDVSEHLEDKGFQVDKDDYHKGITHSYGDTSRRRPLKIGKVLEQTKAPEDIKKAYMKDPYRGAAKASHLVATASRHPFDVAGMSTDRGWTSCMNLTDPRPHKNKLKEDLDRGTHVAYLHHKTDTTISHPVSRVAMKPFHSSTGDHTILRPERKLYGMENPDFHKSVANWAKTNFPAHENVIYNKDKHVYDDDEGGDSTSVLHHTSANVFKKNKIDDLEEAAVYHKLKNHPVSYSDVKDVLPKLKSEHHALPKHIVDNMKHEDLPKMADHKSSTVRRAVAFRYDELPADSKKKLLNDPVLGVKANIAKSSHDEDALHQLSHEKGNALIAANAKRRLEIIHKVREAAADKQREKNNLE
jgi:hypothetical protein